MNALRLRRGRVNETVCLQFPGASFRVCIIKARRHASVPAVFVLTCASTTSRLCLGEQRDLKGVFKVTEGAEKAACYAGVVTGNRKLTRLPVLLSNTQRPTCLLERMAQLRGVWVQAI